MPAITKYKLPVINFGNPITRGLLFDAPLWEGSGIFTNELINKAQGNISASSATWDKNLYGIDLDFSVAASSIGYTLPAILNNLVQQSYECLIYIRSLGGGSAARVFDKGADETYIVLNTGILKFQVNYVTTNGQWSIAIPSFNIWHHVVVTWDGSNLSNVPAIYLDGVPKSITITSTPAGSYNGDNGTFHIGNRAGADRNFDGKISYVRFWKRVLTATEIRSLYSNPWKIYINPKHNFPKRY